MTSGIESFQDGHLRELLREELEIETNLTSFEFTYSGMKDIEAICSLASIKLTIATELLTRHDPAIKTDTKYLDTIGEKARKALALVEGLINARIDETEKAFLLGTKDYQKVKDLIARFLLAGGGVFFEQGSIGAVQSEFISRSVAQAIRRWTEHEDDLEHPSKSETRPGTVYVKFKKIISYFFPQFIPENDQGPPYGLADDENEHLASDHLRLPLSQAIFYLENEVLPRLQKERAESPGDEALRSQVRDIEEQTALLNKMQFFPRSMPVFPEKGFYTDSMTSYTEEGEPVINLRIPVSYRSGTRLEKMQDMVKSEIVRKIAGAGICEELDKEYDLLKRIESGMRGNSRTPSLKLNIDRAFSFLTTSVPGLRVIENPAEFRKLIEYVNANKNADTHKHIARLLFSTKTEHVKLP